jgi:hypothetical protein
MDFTLPDTAQELQHALARWSTDGRRVRYPRTAYSRESWTDFLRWELLSPDFGDTLHRCVGFMEVSRRGLPGPVLEAYLAVCADSSGQCSAALRAGSVVTSVGPAERASSLVGWGAVADLVVDQVSGAVLATAALPAAQFAYALPHGWIVRDSAPGGDPLQAERWLFGAALLAGLAAGALELTVEHTSVRHQFGKPLAAAQAVQFPLAELKMWCEGLRLSVLDAALRRDLGHELWPVSSALAWLNGAQAARLVTSVCHQSFGALGFCTEAGLVNLTWAMSWLRLSVGVDSARGYVVANTEPRLDSDGRPDPGCLVLDGFRSKARP